MDRITQALEWAEKRMAGWEPFTKNQMEILHFAFHELKQLHKPVVMQAEGLDGAEGAAVGNSAAGQSGSDGFECEHYKSLNQQPFYCEHCKKTIT